MKTCHIFGAGEYYIPSFEKKDGDIVIAADAGYVYLKKLGVKPDFCVGDFDSLGYVPEETNLLKLNCIKDYTDTEEAIALGLEKGCTEFRLYCCTGGYLSHTVANAQCLVSLARKGKRNLMYGIKENLTAVSCGSIFLKGQKGRFSIFACGKADGVTVKNAFYPLEDATLTDDRPIGVSNELIASPVVISVKNGTLLILYDNDLDIEFI